MTWKAMLPEDVVRILRFWEDAPWPLQEDEVNDYAVSGLGWTLNEEGFLRNHSAGLNWPNVMTSASRHSTADINLNVTDIEREQSGTREWQRWRNDRYTETVRAITEVWGPPALLTDDYPGVRWDLPSGARAEVIKHVNCVDSTFTTPHAAGVERKLGH
ncbi:MAG: DUF6301 family protein [Phycicoccus sp.]